LPYTNIDKKVIFIVAFTVSAIFINDKLIKLKIVQDWLLKRKALLPAGPYSC